MTHKRRATMYRVVWFSRYNQYATDFLAIILFGGPASRGKAAKTGWCLPMAIALRRYFPTNVVMM
jgi:hypothetical protein